MKSKVDYNTEFSSEVLDLSTLPNNPNFLPRISRDEFLSLDSKPQAEYLATGRAVIEYGTAVENRVAEETRHKTAVEKRRKSEIDSDREEMKHKERRKILYIIISSVFAVVIGMVLNGFLGWV